MKPRNKKKAFTIVELVVVIAVIAVLAAVLIPTFSNIIKKAQTSSDTQLVRNLNTALALDDKEHKTMQSALDAAEEGGFNVAKISSKISENEILWDSKNDVFCYLEDGNITYIPGSVEDANRPADVAYWRITKDVELAQSGSYSVYYTGEVPASGEITTRVGFDAGTTAGITKITYARPDATEEEKQDVVIRTNSYDTELIVNAPVDTVAHYDKAKFIEVIEVAGHSYHEYGKVLNDFKGDKGNIILEPGSEVNIFAPSENVTFTIQEGSSVTSMILDVVINPTNFEIKGDVTNVQLPEFNSSNATEEEQAAYDALTEKIEQSTTADKTNIIERDGTNKFYSSATKTSYESLSAAANASTGTFTITYTGSQGDVIDMGAGQLNILQQRISNKKVVIDLGGAKIESKTAHTNGYYYNLTVPENSSLTICNGSLEIKTSASNQSALSATTGAELILSNINMTTNGAAVYPEGTASRVVIENSNIYTTGAYGVGTNRAQSSAVKIDIKNSTVTSTGSSAVFINTTSTTNIEDSHLIGCVHGLLVRIGHVNVKNTLIETTDTAPGIFDYTAFAEGYGFAPWWQGGNIIPAATVVLGDYYTDDTYADVVSVKFENVKLVSAAEDKIPHVLCAASRAKTSVTLIYDEACVVNRVVLYGEDYVGSNAHTFTHNGSITVNGQDLKSGN